MEINKKKIKLFLFRFEGKHFKFLRRFIFLAYKIFIVPFYFLSVILDFLFIPVAIFYNKRGINVLEAKTSSFGHHLFEPVAAELINQAKNKSSQKRMILLAQQSKAYVKFTNKLLSQKFKIIENYSFFNIYYWLSRNHFCGLSRTSMFMVSPFRSKEPLDIFYEAHYKYRNNSNIFNLDFLNDDLEMQENLERFNPQNRKIIIWKPRCHRVEKAAPFRNTSLETILPLLDKIHADGGIVFGVLYGDAEIQHPALIDLRNITNNFSREKFIFYIDSICDYAIVGQSGGATPLHIFMKPMLVYDVAFPYTIYFNGPKTIVSLKTANYKNGLPVKISTLISLKNQKEVSNLGIIFKSNSSEDLLNLHDELLERMQKTPQEFLAESYDMNLDWGDKIPRNIYNKYGHSQIANYCYQKQIESLSPISINQYQ